MISRRLRCCWSEVSWIETSPGCSHAWTSSAAACGPTSRQRSPLMYCAESGAARTGIAVSTLKEAEYFLDYGVTNILYAVGIAPGKLEHAAALTRRGADLTLILDSIEAAHAVKQATVTFPALI